MPLNRYLIRNEYSLADPDLYRVADKDDPEALLEGVAMAGLVGVLRQLGDLAEFAAEIFHDLHEEVMATAARGHGLIARVQQLEAEFPSVERTLLSQTSHTAFLYNAGVDWHPNLRMDENLVTQGDLPRFVMDSYEECRGPPRLFLLDKFDVAGAGACLKRYTDPSFFKVEAPSSTGRKEGQREKKTRRVKKKVPRWRNGDTPETFPSSHAKLHQLFLEERIESGVNDPERRVKLKKRQFTGSLFDQDKGPSYMEIFLDTCPPEQKVVHEVCIDPLPLTWTSDNGCESGLEIVEIGAVSPLKESIQGNESSCSSPAAGEMDLKPSVEEFSENNLNAIIPSEAVGLPGLNHESDAGKISSTISKAVKSEELSDKESISEVSVDDGCNSDDAASEIDNYMDALATIESEVDTDSEGKKNRSCLPWKPIVVDSDASERQRAPQNLFMDSPSIGNSVTSEDGTSFFKDRENSSCSISVDSLTETRPDLDTAVVIVPSIPGSNSAPENHSSSEGVHENKTDERGSGNTVVVGADEVSKIGQVSREASNSSCLRNPNTRILPVDMEASQTENSFQSPHLDEVYYNSPTPDAVSRSDQGHAYQTDVWACNGRVADAPERTYNGLWSSGEHPVHGMADGKSKSESLPDLSNTPDDLVDLLHLESKTAGSVCLSVEEHGNDLGMSDVDACSNLRPPASNQPIADPDFPATLQPISVVANEDTCISSTEMYSEGQCSASNVIKGFDNQEQLSERMNPDLIPPSDFEAGPSPSSQEDPRVKELFIDDEAEAKASAAPPIVGQTEILLPISNRSETHASESPVSEIANAAETIERGSLEDSSIIEKPSPVLNSSEALDHGRKLPSGESDVTLLELHLAEAGKQYPGSEAIKEGHSISSSGDEYKAEGMFESDSACQDCTPIHSDQLDPVDTVKNLDEIETQETPVDATSEHDRDDKKNCYETLLLPSDLNPVLAVENISDLLHGKPNVGHIETGGDGARQVAAEDYHHENVFCILSSSVAPEKSQEQTASVAKELHQNEEELAPRPSGQWHVDSVQNATLNSNPNMWHLSSHGSPSLILVNGSLTGDDQSSSKCDVVEVPITSECSSQNADSTSFHHIHQLEGKEDVNAISHNRLGGESQMKPFHADELPSQSIGYSAQIQTAGRIDREGTLNAAAYYHGQPSISTLPPQTAVCELDTSRQPMVESSSLFHGNNVLYVCNQATQKVESSGQPIYPPAIPIFGMLPAEPQNNLDAPPLPPLPPMQWRMNRFQNSSSAAERQMVQQTHGPVQPMIVPTTSNETGTVVRTSEAGEQLGYSGFAAHQGVLTLPMEAAVTDVSSQNSLNGNGRDISLPFTAPLTSTMVQTGTQILLEESYRASVNPHEPGSLFQGHTMNNHAADDALLNTEIRGQNNQLEQTPKVTEQEAGNSPVQSLSPTTLHYDWQLPPGLMSPEAERTWSSTHDSIATNIVGNANGTLQKKLPRPRNPLIDEVVAIDKSKFRKVERVKAPVQSKPEEGESLQMQLRKVERVKPPVESKAEERESILEQLQLRKVGERVKPPVEGKADDREFSLEQLQLRKVGERVKPYVDSKTEERETLLEQLKLRKVGERVKPEGEQKPEETESPRVQLRKVGERIKPDVEHKPEETDSPRRQLRKVSERENAVVGSKIEDRDSLMEQIRNKTFSLKPAVAARPNIQGPRTNLKVAAILEKASNIRQAMAGSDEEDDADSWSDC